MERLCRIALAGVVRLAQQKQARLDACLQAAENGNEAAITELGINYFYGTNGVPEDPDAAFYWLSGPRRRMRQAVAFSVPAM